VTGLPACFLDELILAEASLLPLDRHRADALRQVLPASDAWADARPVAMEAARFPELADARSVERSAGPAQAGPEQVVPMRPEAALAPCIQDAAPSAA
jgi:hypothetical protein